MPDSDKPVTIEGGDGKITLVLNETEDATNEGTQMSQIDLSPNVANALMTETIGNIQATNTQNRGISSIAAGVLQGAMSRNFDELGTVESRAVSGVMATPVASPATQSPP